MCLHPTVNSEKENPHILASDSGADFEHGQTG